MSKTLRQKYDEDMALAAAMTPTTKRIVVERCITQIRKDKSVKPLVLCAFLQDHAAIIREVFNGNT